MQALSTHVRSTPPPTCNNTSVGVLVWHPDCEAILLQERAKPPIGIAAPAGHVDDHETYRAAAQRELYEETGLQVTTLHLMYEGRLDFACRRPGGTYHRWQVYQTGTNGLLVPRLDEVRSLGWYALDTIKDLAQRTVAYQEGNIAPSDWEHHPGLEPVWCVIFARLGILDSF